MAVKELVAEQSISRTSEGWAAERSFLVDLPGTTKPAQYLYDAALTAGVPQYGDPHPTLQGVLVTDVSARPIVNGTKNQIKVQVSYAVPDADDSTETDPAETASGSISMSTSLATEQTYFDVNGNFLTVDFKGANFVTIYKNADVQRPEVEVTFRRIEASLPKAVILNYLGKVNSTAWSGFPAKTWLCTKVDVSEEKEGKFDVDYAFSYKPETWRLEVIANLTQEQVNELPPDTQTANGYQIYDVYQSVDFNALGLSF